MHEIQYNLKNTLLRNFIIDNQQFNQYRLSIDFECNGIKLGVYSCIYTENIIDNTKQIDNCNFRFVAPEDWGMCYATIINTERNITHNFNFYKQPFPGKNKQFIKSIKIK